MENGIFIEELLMCSEFINKVFKKWDTDFESLSLSDFLDNCEDF